MDTDHAYEWSFAVVLIIVYAHSRFTTPATARCSTTRAQFYFAEISYVVCSLLLLVLLSGVIVTSPPVINSIEADGLDQIAKELEKLPAPLVAALVMTTLLPYFPVVSDIDKFLLNFFREIGNIPVEVRRLAAFLRTTTLDSTAMAATVRESPNYLKARVDSPDDLQAFLEGNEPGQPEYAFNRVLYIALRLKHWEEDEKLGRACVLFREKFDQIFKRLDELIGLANHFISILRSPTGKRGLTARSHKELRRIILANCEELNYEICDFLAQGILQCARTRRERLRMIREMGFTTIERIRAEISPTKIISLVAIVFLILFFGISIIGALLGHTSNGLGLRLFMSLMVSMNYGAAIYFAITPKRLWDFANIHKVGMRPVIGYIVSGLLAVAAAVVISFIFRAVLFLSFEGSLYSFLFSFPWLGMSFVTAVTIAFLVDDFAIYPERAPKGLRYWESLAAGVMLASAAWYVSLALVQAREWINSLALANVELAWRAMDWRNQIWPHHAPQSGPPSWVMLCSIAFTIGIVLGFEIPHWHRNHSRVADSAEPSKSAPTGNFIRNGLRQGMG